MIAFSRVCLTALPVIVLVIFSGCGDPGARPAKEIYAQIDSTDIDRYLQELASDKYMGRKPCTAAEELTINFLRDEFANLGLQPGNGDSYFQEVPLVEITGHPAGNMTFSGQDNKLNINFLDDFVIFTQRVEKQIVLNNSELVFCGFGIVAPEYGWDDYAGIDMKGKTAVVFVNDPGYYSEDSTFFKGKTMTYYGRWTYKYEEAARQGAEGILIVHETGAAAYPWFVVQTGGNRSKLYLESPDGNKNRCAVEGWLTLDAARKVFQYSQLEGKNFLQMALTPGFRPMPMGIEVSTSIENEIRRDVSQNVIAKIPGTDRADEYLIYSSHWDHMGIGATVEGDSIYNGAMDNASGLATMLAVAKEFAEQEQKPSRTVIFLAVTAEEQGLLGSEWYAKHPLYPIENTVANLNKDGANVIGEMNDLTITGYGQSTLDDLAAEVAAKQDRYIAPEQFPEKGSFFRSDHFNFARVGVPAFYANGSGDHRIHGKEYAKSKSKEYVEKNYHRPSDEYTDDWILSGIVQDAELYFNMGWRLATEPIYPQWKEGSEFKHLRELKK